MDIIDIAIAKSKATAIDPSDISSAVSSYLNEHNIENVSDVQIDGVSVVSDGVAEIPIANNNQLGAVKVNSYYGIDIVKTGMYKGHIQTVLPSDAQIKDGVNNSVKPSVSQMHKATFYGLAKVAGYDEKDSTLPLGTYSEGAKSAIYDMLNGAVLVEGTTPTITALSGVRYICGEVATLDFTPCATGICDIFFVSGSTPTVVTLPNTVKFPNGEFVTEADTAYEINILDGIYGVVMSWT